MLFSKKESAASRTDALALITDAFEDMEQVTDGTYLESYINGLASMAFALGAITVNEKAGFIDRAHAKAVELKAKVEPVYKKKGVYEYNGYYILKNFAADGGSGSACWRVRAIEGEELLTPDITFKEARKYIDELK